MTRTALTYEQEVRGSAEGMMRNFGASAFADACRVADRMSKMGEPEAAKRWRDIAAAIGEVERTDFQLGHRRG